MYVDASAINSQNLIKCQCDVARRSEQIPFTRTELILDDWFDGTHDLKRPPARLAHMKVVFRSWRSHSGPTGGSFFGTGHERNAIRCCSAWM